MSEPLKQVSWASNRTYLLVIERDLLRCFFAQLDPIGSVDFACDYTDFFLNGSVQIVQIAEALLVSVARIDDGLGKLQSAFSAFTPMERRNGCICAGFECSNSNSFQFGIRVRARIQQWPWSASYANLFIATTTGTPNLTAFCICFAMLLHPARTKSTFSVR